MSSSIFQESWDHVFSLGTKCNTHSIRRKVGIPGFSSPFDSMDSVHGLRDCARVISIGSSAYFGERHNWILRNDYASRSTVVRAKVLYNSDYPGLFYPHFYSGWFDQPVADQLSDWILDPNSSLDVVWEGFRSTFSRRLDRLVDFLQEGRKVLFLRIDDKASLARIYSQGNNVQDLDYACSRLNRAGYLNFKVLYFYTRSSQYFREIPSGSHWHAIGVDVDSFDDQVSTHLSQLQVG